jgi:type IV secretory pathway TrbD component
MPALRALAITGFLAGTGFIAAGVIADDAVVASIGIAMWSVGVAIGVWVHRASL